MRHVFSLGICGALFMAGAHGVQAEDTRGRTADGRAYRVDAEGNEIVDYIAELEISIEGLNRQVASLEDELKEKNEALARAGASTKVAGLTERTIGSAPSRDQEPSADLSAELRSAKEAVSHRDAELQKAQEQVAALNRELASVRKALTEAEASREVALQRVTQDSAGALASCSAELSRVRSNEAEVRKAALAEKEALAERAQEELLDARDSAKEALAAREASLREEFDDQLRSLQSERDEARGELVRLKAEHAEAETILLKVRDELQRAKEQTVEVPRAAAPVLQVASREEPRASLRVANNSLDRSRSAALQSLRGAMLAELNKLRGAIATRDSLFERSAGRLPSGLKVKPSRLVSSAGSSVEGITTAIKRAVSVHELAAIRREISEIQAKVQEDTNLVTRMVR